MIILRNIFVSEFVSNIFGNRIESVISSPVDRSFLVCGKKGRSFSIWTQFTPLTISTELKHGLTVEVWSYRVVLWRQNLIAWFRNVEIFQFWKQSLHLRRSEGKKSNEKNFIMCVRVQNAKNLFLFPLLLSLLLLFYFFIFYFWQYIFLICYFYHYYQYIKVR